MTHQTGSTIQTPSPEGLVNLALGQPSPSLLPLEGLAARAATRLGAGGDRLVLQYGAIAGTPALRTALAALLARRTGRPVDPEGLLITAGNSLALSMVCQVLAPPGGTVVCEDPTYFLAAGILRTAGLHVFGVATDADGLRVDLLEAALERGAVHPDLVYVIPTFHNPTGCDLSPGRAERLVELAEAHDFRIVADEPYDLLHFDDDRAPNSMASIDRGRGRVVALGSFSKILAPGLRCGWIEGLPELIGRLSHHGVLRSGGALNPVVSAIVHETIEDGFLDDHIERLRTTYRSRSRALADALRARLPSTSFAEPRGGYFLWLDLGEGVSSAALVGPAEERGVRFCPGSRCAVERDLDRFVRLSWAFHDEAELALGVERLAGTLAADD